MAFTNPQYSDFVTFYPLDWPYGSDPGQSITPAEVGAAFQRVNNYGLNPVLFKSQGEWNQAYLLLAGHYLVLIVRASGQGLAGRGAWVTNSKAVGAVSESFSIPQRILDNPAWAMFTQTNYGLQFLEYVIPRLGGNIGTVRGHTKPG